MLLFCDGMPRSATTWVYNVAFALLRAAFPAGDIRRTHNEDSRAALDAIGSGADWEVVKCHRLDEHARAIFRARKAKAIYTHRDIYDAIASYLIMFRFSFKDCLNVMGESLDVYDFHRETGNFLHIDYESVVARPGESIHAIAGFLNLSLLDATVEAIQEVHSFQAIKELSAKLKLTEADRLVRTSISCYDPQTQWHVRHIRNGGIGYGRRYLLPQQIEQIEDLIRNRQGPSKDLLPAVEDSPALTGARA